MSLLKISVSINKSETYWMILDFQWDWSYTWFSFIHSTDVYFKLWIEILLNDALVRHLRVSTVWQYAWPKNVKIIWERPEDLKADCLERKVVLETRCSTEQLLVAKLSILCRTDTWEQIYWLSKAEKQDGRFFCFSVNLLPYSVHD